MLPQDHTKFIIGCITLLAMTSALCGGWLLWKGYAGGGELIMTVNSAVAGMIGFLANKKPEPRNDVPTVTAPLASTVTVTPTASEAAGAHVAGVPTSSSSSTSSSSNSL